MGIKYYSTSAKEGTNVEEAFLELVKLNLDKVEKQEMHALRKSMKLVKEVKKEKKKSCC